MSLNEGVTDDLQDMPIVDNDIVNQPQAVAKTAEPITIIPETDEVKAQGVMSEEDLQKLPAMDVSFKIVEDGHSKIVELKEVEAEIIAQETISRHGAEYISTAFEDFLSGPVKLVEFTNNPSKTNYQYALNHMSKVIAKEEASVIANFQLLIDNPLNDGKALLSTLESSYIPSVVSQIYALRGRVMDLTEKFRVSKDLVVPYGDQFIDLTKIDLKTLDVEQISGKQFDKKTVKSCVESIQKLIKCPYVNALIWTLIEGKGYSNIKDPETRMSYQGCAITMADLLKFYSTDIDSIIEEVRAEASDALTKMSLIQEESSKHKETQEATRMFISEHIGTLQDCFTSVGRLCHLVNDLSCLTFSSEGLIQFYETF